MYSLELLADVDQLSKDRIAASLRVINLCLLGKNPVAELLLVVLVLAGCLGGVIKDLLECHVVHI